MRRMLRLLIVVGLLLIPTVAKSAGPTPASAFDLHAVVATAAPEATVSVPPGRYVGALVIDKPLHLIGAVGPNGERAVIDGDGHGSVLVITAPGTIVENLVIRNSGNQLDKEDAGIVVENAAHVQLVGNRVEDVLYGVRASQANALTIRDNQIVGRDLDVARRGDGMRLWQSEGSLVEGNTVEHTRDVLFWYSDHTVVQNNHFQHNRYGIHMMSSDAMRVMGNTSEHNSVGAYFMYGIDVLLEGNILRENRGPSGYGVALKDMDGVTVRENYFFDNRVGLFFDNSPARIEIEQSIERNVLAYNDVGVLMMPAVQRNVLRQNTFIDNLDQVGVKGGGSQPGDLLGGNRWDGNYWSDYVGFDSDAAGQSDGIGELPYRAESLFENLADRHPHLQLFHFSPVETAIDLAAQAFPIIKPKPKLTDATPLMSPVLPRMAAPLPPTTGAMGWLAAGLLLTAVALFGSQWQVGWRRLLAQTARTQHADAPALAAPSVLPTLATPSPQAANTGAPCCLTTKEPTMISIKHLTKQYPQPGRPWWSDATVTAVQDLSFNLSRGEALALWGSNGAGKTTVLKCLLGLLACEGELHISGRDLRRDGRRARRLLGYVPQELSFHNDLSVLESCRFYAHLKQMPPDGIPDSISDVLAQVGLAAQMQKRVGALSGGMKQRLALALALLGDPPVLLLDEPTSNLDAATRADFLRLLMVLRQAGKALLFTSHQVAEVEQLAEQVLILANGQRVAQGSPRELMAHLLPESRYAAYPSKVIGASTHSLLAQPTLAQPALAEAPYRTR